MMEGDRVDSGSSPDGRGIGHPTLGCFGAPSDIMKTPQGTRTPSDIHNGEVQEAYEVSGMIAIRIMAMP
ncbi:MAG: hypothetical protein PHU23_04235 [Dehalococcoidales bacterium]|nr:hypothetical protein [Dehalococcoidales bacterium]